MPVKALEALTPIDLDTRWVRILDVAELEFELPSLPGVCQVLEFISLKAQLGYRTQAKCTHPLYELSRSRHDQLPVMQARQDHDNQVEDPGRDVAYPEVVDDFTDLRPAGECLVDRDQGLARRDAGRRHQQQARDKALLQQLVEHYPGLFRVHDPAMMPHTADRSGQVRTPAKRSPTTPESVPGSRYRDHRRPPAQTAPQSADRAASTRLIASGDMSRVIPIRVSSGSIQGLRAKGAT